MPGRFVGAAGCTHDAGDRVGEDEADSRRDDTGTERRVEGEESNAVNFVAGWPSPSLGRRGVDGPVMNRRCDRHDDAEDGHAVAGGGEVSVPP